ncbi:hypothetical protein ACW9H6_29075 [Pseudomonas sp. SDO528_S397]
MDFLHHHFVLAGMFVSDFQDAEPEILREILPALGVQFPNSGVPTMPVVCVV